MNPLRPVLVNKYVKQGYEALAVGDIQKALDVSLKLYELQHTAAFEIRGRALWAVGDRKQAIIIMEQGTQAGPDSYVLWDYLASFYSDEGWYDQAIEAYHKALECPDVERVATLYNIALVYQRCGRHDKCIETLKDVDCMGHPIESLVISTLAHSLSETGEPQRALELMDSALESSPEFGEHTYALHMEKAWAEFVLGDREAALRDAHRAVELSMRAGRAAWLIRELSGVRSETARRFALSIEGLVAAVEGEVEAEQFFQTWYVVAESPEDGLELVRSHVPPFAREGLKLIKSQDDGPSEGDPTGVYGAAEGWFEEE